MRISQNDGQNVSKKTNPLSSLGWTPYFQAFVAEVSSEDGSDNTAVARVVGARKNSFVVACNGKNSTAKVGNSTEADGDMLEYRLATVAGSLLHHAQYDGHSLAGALFPVVGDWVMLRDSVISTVLPRKNALSRGASGARGGLDGAARQAQVMAANLDTVFIVSGLDQDFNVRRIERYLTLVYNCGLTPVIVLTKADLTPDLWEYVDEVESVAFGVPVHTVAAGDDSDVEELRAYLGTGMTATMVGSSGAGKSTLVNRLVGEEVQLTRGVSESDGKGRHTTTTRDLILLPCGGMIIDNPGIREIAFWDDRGGVDSAFPEIDALAEGCRFLDCTHTHEPGCAVLAAAAGGNLRQDRLDSYHKMQRELSYLSLRQEKSADQVEKERWKWVSQKARAIKKERNRG